MLLALLALALFAIVLSLPLIARSAAQTTRRMRRLTKRRPSRSGLHAHDPGRERRAEQRARELLRSCVNDEEWAMYRDLGFIRVEGKRATPSGPAPYAYLIYPHKPIVSYVPSSGRLLSEYCVDFPDLGFRGARGRLPASDDVLAKWMALTGDEKRLINEANMHLPGRQVDPARVRRDLWRLQMWERERRDSASGAEKR
ncbi:MAG TPA: hypothetical protein VE570_15880 [Thermoleophilaceae bacterium]|jgi:hypothetical protein|nr:hypothetical protein [Thermoleophilaceae bacterium]